MRGKGSSFGDVFDPCDTWSGPADTKYEPFGSSLQNKGHIWKTTVDLSEVIVINLLLSKSPSAIFEENIAHCSSRNYSIAL